MEKKSAKNCTLYHVVNKAVWADIGAASTSSTNILVLQTLQHQYIGATMFLAPIYWCYNVLSTNISPYSFVYHVVKCTVFGGFFLHVFFMATDMAPRPPPLTSVKVGSNEN